MRIGLDVDGVLYHFHKTALYMLNTMKGYDLKEEDWTYWNQPKDVVKNNDWQWLWSKGVELGLFRYGHLYKGAIEGVRELATLGDIVIITHRPRNAIRDTLDWLAYLRLPIHEIHLQTDGQFKSTVEPHCDLYVDDKPENIEDFANNTHAVPLLWNRPWNASYGSGPRDLLGDYQRIDSWKQVIDNARLLN